MQWDRKILSGASCLCLRPSKPCMPLAHCVTKFAPHPAVMLCNHVGMLDEHSLLWWLREYTLNIL